MSKKFGNRKTWAVNTLVASDLIFDPCVKWSGLNVKALYLSCFVTYKNNQ